MSREVPPPGDEGWASALRDGLAARDRAARAPRFGALLPQSHEERTRWPWRPVALAASLVGVALLSWLYVDRSQSPPASPVDPVLARQLSSPDYWRVPSDVLLAYAEREPQVDLPSPPEFQVSLEDSVL